MEYIIAKDGRLVREITETGNVLWDANNFCTPEALIKDGKAEHFGVEALCPTEPPTIDPVLQVAIRDGVAFNSHRWEYKWKIVNLEPVVPDFGVNTQVALLDGYEVVGGVYRQKWRLELIEHTQPPTDFDSMTHAAVMDGSEFVDGVWRLKWRVEALSAQQVAANQAAKAASDREAAKAARAVAVNAIAVTTASGKVFDGNEDAQRRMTTAITAMDDTDELDWVLHDNSVQKVGRTELREALRLAGASMSQIWIAPYLEN